MQKTSKIFFTLMVFTACNSNTPSEKSTSTQATDITRVKDTALNYKIDTSRQVNTLLVKRDTLLIVDIHNARGSVRGYLSGIGKHVTIIVPVNEGDSLTATLVPGDSVANIRFNQIYIPDGKAGKYDGPFTRTISYPISVKGNYKLIAGENLMSGRDWKGSFTCEVAMKTKK